MPLYSQSVNLNFNLIDRTLDWLCAKLAFWLWLLAAFRPIQTKWYYSFMASFYISFFFLSLFFALTPFRNFCAGYLDQLISTDIIHSFGTKCTPSDGYLIWNFPLQHRWISSVHKAMGSFSDLHVIFSIKCSAMDSIQHHCKCCRKVSNLTLMTATITKQIINIINEKILANISF